VQPGETLFAIATAYAVSIEALMQANNLVNSNLIQVGQTLQLPGSIPSTAASWPTPFSTIELSEPTISQGRTLVIKVNLADASTLSGQFEGRPIFFNSTGPGQFWGMTPMHAMEPPNTYPITLTATRPDGSLITATPNITVVDGPYGWEDIQLDTERSQLLNADLIQQEQQILAGYWSQVSPHPRWEGPFSYPVESVRLTSYFGTRRTYNESAETSFHGGLDFGGETGTPVYAPAAGRVALAQPLTIRGNAILIDHGLGLFSGYWHLNQIAVSEGQEVQRGDLIGYLGGTGLATGPHLHWEMRLNGIAVEPLQWVQQIIP
jgi:murein DD-endopeptidase MepM/ murein hydrolase activator NlpD